MAQNPKLKIEIEAVDKVSGTLEEAAKALKDLSSSLKQTARATEEAEKKHRSFVSVLRSETQKAGRYVEQLNGRFRALTSALINLKTAVAAALGGFTFSEIVKGGIEFNSQLQTAKLGLAALITSAYELRDAQGQVLSGMEAFKAAQAEAEELYRKILYRAMQTASTSQELLQTFQAILPFAAQMGISLEQVLNLSEALVNAAKAIGLGYGQAAQEGRDLLMGYVDQNDQLLRALGLNRELLQTWKEQGTLYENAMRKLHAFVQASEEFGDTWEGVTSSISDLISMLEGSVFKDTFHVMNKALKEARDQLQNLLNDEEKLKSVSKEIALKFIDAAEGVYTAANELYNFGKSIYDFVHSHKEITEFGVIGYLLLGKRGVILGALLGQILEEAKKEISEIKKDSSLTSLVRNVFTNPLAPFTNPIGIYQAQKEEQERIKELLTIKNPYLKELTLPDSFRWGEKFRNDPYFSAFFAREKSLENKHNSNFFDRLRKAVLEEEFKNQRGERVSFYPKPSPGPQEQGEFLSTFEVTQNLLSSQSLSLFSSKTLEERLLESALNKKEPFNYDFGLSKSFESSMSLMPDYGLEIESLNLESQVEIEKASQRIREQYLEFAKEHKPEEWKKLKIEELRQWYEEQKRILGGSEELQELYEHKRLEIEKTAHEQEKKLYIEKLRQTSSWKAGVFQSLDELAKKWGDTNQLIYDATTQTFQALENSLETIFFDAMRGKLKSLGDYVNSFLASVESAIAGIAAQGVAKGVVGFVGKVFGFDIKTAANGDIFPGHFIPLQAFADGGVVNRPTLGLIGEGRYPEAIVPLPDGRSIPVKFEGRSSPPINLEIVIVDDRSKVPAPQIGKKQVVLWVAEDYMQNGILRKVIKA